MLASSWRGVVNGPVGGIELVWQKRDEVFSELMTAKKSLGTKAVTSYIAIVCVISFHYEKVFW